MTGLISSSGSSSLPDTASFTSKMEGHMFKFNGGDGAVVCDRCRVIIDSGLSYKEYEECYNGPRGDFCPSCNDRKGGKAVTKVRKKKVQES